MAYSLSIAPDGSVVELVATGAGSSAGFAHVIAAMLEHPLYRRGAPILIDRRESVDLPTTREVRSNVSTLARHRDALGSCRIAVVVTSAAAYGMARMGQALADDLPIVIRIFSEETEARRWLREGTDVTDREAEVNSDDR